MIAIIITLTNNSSTIAMLANVLQVTNWIGYTIVIIAGIVVVIVALKHVLLVEGYHIIAFQIAGNVIIVIVANSNTIITIKRITRITTEAMLSYLFLLLSVSMSMAWIAIYYLQLDLK